MPFLRCLRLGAASGLLAALVAFPSMADERNPFVPPPTDIEKRLEEEERMRSVVRQMLQQYENSLLDKIDSRFGDTMLKMLDEQMKGIKSAEPQPEQTKVAAIPSAAVPGIPSLKDAAVPSAPPSQTTQPAAEKVAAKLPAGVKFVACVKGKSLYREQTSGTEFFSEARSSSGIDYCR